MIFELSDDQYWSLQYLSFIAWSFTQIVLILVSYKQPSLLNGLASILITWSKAVRSNSFNYSMLAKARLSIQVRLFGKTSLLDSRSLQFWKAPSPISSTPSSKLSPIISLLLKNKLWWLL